MTIDGLLPVSAGAFALASFLIELTPGPNMTWLVLVAAQQGRRAGFMAVLGVALGLALIGVPLTYEYSIVWVGVWLCVLMSIAVVASLGPARNAVRLTIREVLAYE